MTGVMVMASPISATLIFCSSSASTKPINCSLSSSASYHQTPKFHFSRRCPQLGPTLFSPWIGSKHLGISVTAKALKFGRKRRCKNGVVYASLFGVGAPEALVIGVVALLVFGPKGLAEVARNLGKTLRAFQPTIRELQEVSREFKSTLEREIGLDEISSSAQNTNNSNKTNTPSVPSSPPTTVDSGTMADPNGASSLNRAYTTEEYLKITDEQLKSSASQQQGQPPSPEVSQFEPQTQPEATIQETAAATSPSQKPEGDTRNPMQQSE
ncbi:hypothetical protein SLEP1_g3439 [Rubroshorea leprosula]|uniref:Sec-independent protein translocase protein TATB, chloroplastic n=1 Tax=Rubroshorea leprosula TaxID=152421 RepID=A0AAV5HR47_9ROSI|nr:hypothetical protein SLEP1_g3439 [Rubroshorea leprosula]